MNLDAGLAIVALLSTAIMGYLYAKGGERVALRQNLLKSVTEVENEKKKVQGKIRNTPLRDLINRANERLRKRREPPSSGGLGT